MRIHWLLSSLLGVGGLLLMAPMAEAAQLQSWQFNASESRLTFTTDDGIQPRVQLVANPTRLIIDLPETRWGRPRVEQAGGGAIEQIRIAQFDAQTTRIVIELKPGYTLNPRQVQVRGENPSQWTVQLPALERVEEPLQTPQPPPVRIETETTESIEADTQLEGIRVTQDGFFFRFSGDTPDVEQELSNDRRQLVLELEDTALSPELSERTLAVDRYGVNRIQLVQAQVNPPVVQIILDLAANSPEWQASASNLGGVILVPANGTAAAQPERRTSQSLTRQSPPPSPAPTIPPAAPPAPRPAAPALPNVADSRITVVIDPGHGGGDPGAVGIGGLQEKDIVLPISIRVAQVLEQQGVQAILTRQDDREIDLEPRVQVANRADADLFVSIHANAIDLSRPDINGLETYYYSSATSRQLAQTIQASVVEATGMRNIGVKEARFYVLRRTLMPAVLVETGFVTGRDDAARLADPAFRDRMAEAIARGILQYIQQNF